MSAPSRVGEGQPQLRGRCKKDLYMAESLNGLDKQISDIRAKYNTESGRGRARLIGRPLLSQAKELETSGDEEMAYFYYMQYIQVVRKFINKSSDFAKTRQYYDTVLSQKDFLAAAEVCVVLF